MIIAGGRGGSGTIGDVILAIHVSGNQVGDGLGHAHTMAVADVQDGQVTSWQEFDVGWDESHPSGGHDEADGPGGSHGAHHARIVRFMREHNVQAVVTGHIGPPMAHTLDLMGIAVVTAQGDARELAVAVVDALAGDGRGLAG